MEKVLAARRRRPWLDPMFRGSPDGVDEGAADALVGRRRGRHQPRRGPVVTGEHNFLPRFGAAYELGHLPAVAD